MILFLFLIRTSNLLTAGTQTLDVEGQASHIWDCSCHLRHVILTLGAAGGNLRCGHCRSGTEMGKKSNLLTAYVQTHPKKAVYIHSFSNKGAVSFSDLKAIQLTFYF